MSTGQLYGHLTIKFQFYDSTIKSLRFLGFAYNRKRFNSTIVRLKVDALSGSTALTLLFQFYDSTIKSSNTSLQTPRL